MDEVLAAVQELGPDIHDYEFYNSVAELDAVPDSATFYKDFVSHNRPCVIRGAISNWSAAHNWDLDYISECMGTARVTCTFTCDGKADSIQHQHNGDSRFVLPDNRQMTMKEFVSIFRQSKSDASPVPSVQYQNNNWTEFEKLTEDIDVSFPWAFEAFGATKPDAVNLWIGDHRSTTTYHKVCLRHPNCPADRPFSKPGFPQQYTCSVRKETIVCGGPLVRRVQFLADPPLSTMFTEPLLLPGSR